MHTDQAISVLLNLPSWSAVCGWVQLACLLICLELQEQVVHLPDHLLHSLRQSFAGFRFFHIYLLSCL